MKKKKKIVGAEFYFYFSFYTPRLTIIAVRFRKRILSLFGKIHETIV